MSCVNFIFYFIHPQFFKLCSYLDPNIFFGVLCGLNEKKIAETAFVYLVFE